MIGWRSDDVLGGQTLCRWKDDTEGVDESGGDGSPDSWMLSIGVLITTTESDASATVGDCNGDWTGIASALAGKSTMRGGRSGVVAKFSESSTSLLRFALSMSIEAGVKVCSSGSSKMLLVGVGGNWNSRLSVEWMNEPAIEDDRDRFESAPDRSASLNPSVIEIVLPVLLVFHFREKEGNLVPSRAPIPSRGESPARRFLAGGSIVKSPSLKEARVRSYPADIGKSAEDRRNSVSPSRCSKSSPGGVMLVNERRGGQALRMFALIRWLRLTEAIQRSFGVVKYFKILITFVRFLFHVSQRSFPGPESIHRIAENGG